MDNRIYTPHVIRNIYESNPSFNKLILNINFKENEVYDLADYSSEGIYKIDRHGNVIMTMFTMPILDENLKYINEL